MTRPRLLVCAIFGVLACVTTLSPAAAAASGGSGGGRLQLAGTTAVVTDIVRNVAGDRADVAQLIPNGADPHSWEPTLRDTRTVAHADAVFSNNLLLEENSLIHTIDANISAPERHIRLAEESKTYGAHLIQLVEDRSLDTVWLGMRVRAEKLRASGGDDEVRIRVRDVQGPGTVAAYLTGTFGQPQPYINSGDGIDHSDVVALPLNAHTHMSWAFTAPGIYRMQVDAERAPAPGQPATATLPPVWVTFAVGVDPAKAETAMGAPPRTTLASGHVDLSANWDSGALEFFGDRADGGPGDASYDPATTLVVVPEHALTEVPGDPAYRFLGAAGDHIYVLAQAVLGKHVHGEIDPHVWQSVPNVSAEVDVIRDTLIRLDPAGASTYRANAARYQARLARLDAYMREVIGSIPPQARNLVTTHDAYGYLGHEYGLTITAFVTPNPGVEPSTTDLIRLNRSLKSLDVPAVFVEPMFATYSRELVEAAGTTHRRVCTLYGDTFTPDVDSYVEAMASNAYNLKVCLDPAGAPPARFEAPRPPKTRAHLLGDVEKGTTR
ncbi:anchored repeat ABC transporter, substrate-binding protein [Nanchangia anserum]|uniref:Anchored repeat ABC transporter, substrate-binding protein n=1 Tax=Nanchangia anserum TaxID=2692125 RepID=A0A8I0KRS0_9ACTO|nr:anchored repeat ABC transporter, substrate-binding protein [Nanchangia anserum]MBD3689677.1 anchored repeat ABC transporter, substrate-binding protein [Nanchangia anserum]QOX81854.1 anchored repeat ABC transporter, substrate-binding protein [Nanchangia anserum]